MHEEALLADLRRAIERTATGPGGGPIRAVTIWIGALSHVTEPSLRARWTDVVRGSSAEGARLTVQVSEDPFDPRATAVVLREVRVEGPP